MSIQFFPGIPLIFFALVILHAQNAVSCFIELANRIDAVTNYTMIHDGVSFSCVALLSERSLLTEHCCSDEAWCCDSCSKTKLDRWDLTDCSSTCPDMCCPSEGFCGSRFICCPPESEDLAKAWDHLRKMESARSSLDPDRPCGGFDCTGAFHKCTSNESGSCDDLEYRSAWCDSERGCALVEDGAQCICPHLCTNDDDCPSEQSCKSQSLTCSTKQLQSTICPSHYCGDSDSDPDESLSVSLASDSTSFVSIVYCMFVTLIISSACA
eukprot:gnl/TRDRNA2_/TRDRNA2_63589_c0_seq1.p1 gnl/TRDRNA2_/TRDRNA2_63589_c0~~gnl/TRDRNA2_/TRDRNA2_63589_c0_seq1.p1  ORF type:complete len:268 (-),score=9.74 gnl/TRDRNA2_/TRDRNA2_63589_c0_seq1:98-901(-)